MVTRPNIVIHKPQTIRIVGIGGQGSVLAAVVLAEALMMEGNWVVQSQSWRTGTRRIELRRCFVQSVSHRISHR